MKPFIFLALGMFFVLGVIIFGNVMQSSDYEASNETGDMTASTNQTLTIVQVNYSWWWAVAVLITIFALAMVLRMYM